MLKQNNIAEPEVPAPRLSAWTSASFGLITAWPSRLAMVAAVLASGMVSLTTARAAAPHRKPNKTSTKYAGKTDEIPLHCPAQFVTAIVPDGHRGVWVSGEDTGVYHGTLSVRFNHAESRSRSEPLGLSHRAAGQLCVRTKWSHFDTSNSPGLASNFITTLCVERWPGQQNITQSLAASWSMTNGG